MNREDIIAKAREAGFSEWAVGLSEMPSHLEHFAKLIITECTALLFDQSEKLFELCSEENNMSTAQEYELCSNQCLNNIDLIEKHFGVEE